MASKLHTPSTKAPNITNPGAEYNYQQMLQLTNHLKVDCNQNYSANNHIIEHVGGLTTLHWLGDY